MALIFLSRFLESQSSRTESDPPKENGVMDIMSRRQNAGGGIRTHEPLRDGIPSRIPLSPTSLTWLDYPRRLAH